ncbi:hypothetical protein AWB69_08051 [Caballeronia udeis]|uniref:Uncharacterized protein n=2 Tax=Caballeronia udeis TaxID=1232866 RepID=A0A158JJF6_9BURK|nr:hypothetical protein AWB69_08051 [Caballeronia udeis]
MYELKRLREAGLSAKIKTWDFGAMLLTSYVVQGDVQFHRTRKKISMSGIDQYLVHCLVGGELTSEFAQG